MREGDLNALLTLARSALTEGRAAPLVRSPVVPDYAEEAEELYAPEEDIGDEDLFSDIDDEALAEAADDDIEEDYPEEEEDDEEDDDRVGYANGGLAGYLEALTAYNRSLAQGKPLSDIVSARNQYLGYNPKSIAAINNYLSSSGMEPSEIKSSLGTFSPKDVTGLASMVYGEAGNTLGAPTNDLAAEEAYRRTVDFLQGNKTDALSPYKNIMNFNQASQGYNQGVASKANTTLEGFSKVGPHSFFAYGYQIPKLEAARSALENPAPQTVPLPPPRPDFEANDEVASLESPDTGDSDAALFADGGPVLEDEYPTEYMPEVGRQVMADGGVPEYDALAADATYDEPMSDRARMRQSVSQMTGEGYTPEEKEIKYQQMADLGNALAETGPAKAAKAAYGAVTLPGDVLYGRVDPRSKEGIDRAVELAGLAMTGGFPMKAPQGSLRMFAGRNSKTADMDALETAKLMEKKKIDRETIFEKTGWYKAPDKNRFVGIGWSPDRIQRELAHSHYDDGRAKASLGWVDPKDFLKLTTRGPSDIKTIRKEAGDLSMARLSQESQTPFLIADYSPDILSHEGRHRMSALSDSGYNRVPIVIRHKNILEPKAEPSSVWPLITSRHAAHATNNIPLHRRYEDKINEIMSLFGQRFERGGKV
jgi:hypothetical protein